MNLSSKDGYPYYLGLAGNKSCQALFSSTSTFDFLNSINEEKANYRYARDKWSVKQVVGHITDHERIKMHRAFLMSRGDNVELWGYDQNALVENSRFEELTMQELVNDFKNVRMASISLLEGLSASQLVLKGLARQHKTTLEDFLKTIIGHEIHHLNIIKDRYF